MRSTTVAILCLLAMSLTLDVAAQEMRTTPGPLEKAANPITPENPIPRRAFSVAPAYPAEARALEASATVVLRVTLDTGGRIAEIRRTINPFVTVGPGAPSDGAALQSVGEALIRSAGSALSQWQYDSPASGPISFDVAFAFRPGAETASTQNARLTPQGAPMPGGGAAPPTTPWPAAVGAIRVGGQIRAPMRTNVVNPVYPALAQSARVQGVVILEAIIGEDGRVRDARILRSIPLLDQAALDAVRQWEYVPTLLNGKPTAVVMTVTVQFTMPAPPPPPAQ